MKITIISILVIFLFGEGLAQRNGFSTVYKTSRIFSSIEHADTFILSAAGKNIFDSHITLRIVSWKGKEIYHDRFSMNDFMERGPKDKRTQNDSIGIIEMLSQFLDEGRFDKASRIVKNALDESSGELALGWKEFQADTVAISFNYLLGAEDGRSIAFSKTKRKAIIYFRCC
jgi:hypothetical protein